MPGFLTIRVFIVLGYQTIIWVIIWGNLLHSNRYIHSQTPGANTIQKPRKPLRGMLSRLSALQKHESSLYLGIPRLGCAGDLNSSGATCHSATANAKSPLGVWDLLAFPFQALALFYGQTLQEKKVDWLSPSRMMKWSSICLSRADILLPQRRGDLCSNCGCDILCLLAPQSAHGSHVTRSQEAAAWTNDSGQIGGCDEGRVV